MNNNNIKKIEQSKPVKNTANSVSKHTTKLTLNCNKVRFMLKLTRAHYQKSAQ